MNRAIILAPRKHICKGVAVSTWAERLRWIVDKYEGGNGSGMARKIGKTPQQVSNYLSGANVPSADVLEAVAGAYPAVSPTWLLTGKGSRTQDTDDVKLRSVSRAELDDLRALLRDALAIIDPGSTPP